MKTEWLNLVLKITNKIFRKKQTIIEKEGMVIIMHIVALLFYELVLAIISLPLYVGVRSAKVVAFFKEKGAYEKITYDYNLRRVLTLTSASIILIIWLMKLTVILSVPRVYGPLNLYSVSELRPADLLEQEIVVAETQIQTARIDPSMRIPELVDMDKTRAGQYNFYGTGKPNSRIVLFISDIQTLILTDLVDESGNWQINHIQDDFTLSEGNHSAVVFGYDQKNDSRSRLSTEKHFRVQTSYLDRLIKNTDIFINSSIIIVLMLGVLLTVLTM